MGDIIDFKTGRRVEPQPGRPPSPNRLHPGVDLLLRRYYRTRGDAGVLAGTVVQLLDTLDLICMTAECSAIDAGSFGQADHPYNVIVEMCRDVLDSKQF